jgi:ATP-dependent helicase/nuclease subunit B
VPQTTPIEVPAHLNILQYTATYIFENFQNQAPDFSNLFVLLPHSLVTQQFNETLCCSLAPDYPAIIPPWAGTLKDWAKQFVSNEHTDYQLIGEQTRQLLFIEALQQHPDLFDEKNKWQITQALLNLFDEISLNQKNIFTSAEKWQHQLQQAYGTEEQFQYLLYESKLVYTLWHAWQQQLNENQLYDETGDYLSRLNNAHTIINQQQRFICLGLSQYSKTEQDFIQNLVDNNQCFVIDYANSLTTDRSTNETNKRHAFSSFISETFNHNSLSFKQRAHMFGEEFPEIFSAKPPFSIYLAKNEEQQVRAIDYFVRLNVVNNKNKIAIISEDRKLSRRLRALLERANIQLHDKAGWSLATTQASTIIERWLECIEEDFSAYPLLDCLKSPFINITQATDETSTKETFRKNIYRFEHDLIFHENVSSNIKQYKKQLKNRLKRLTHWPSNTYDDLINTLNFIDNTARPLSRLYSANNNINLSDFLDTLLISLEQLGVLQSYRNDDAGLVLLKTFEDLKQSLKHSNPALEWHDCRIWLGMALESQFFTPSTNNSNVQLMTLEQAAYNHFDCIIIAATESQHFPGSPNISPFFNQAVRASLELCTWDEQYKQRHELFNRVLLSAPEILLTACNEEKGEEKPVSPWLELLINFYNLAYNKKPGYKTLYNEYLQQLVQSNSEVFQCDDTQLPDQSIQPASSIPADLLPEKISASSYQRIINCPYQFFTADGLHLKPLEELSDELKKSDYGERIHLILQVFHNGHAKYGSAFTNTITANNRSEAENYLSELSNKIFATDLESNVLHRSWLHRWKKHIPAYINWQIQHQIDWDIYFSEKNLEVDLEIDSDNSLTIYGRLDRIDINKENQSHAIIDYKTGKTARQEDVDIGENVQLSVYALLDNETSEVSYLSVDSTKQKVEGKSSLSGVDLQQNREQNKQRLIELFKQMKNNEILPAWGDDTVCHYCNFSGICRKSEWSE